MLSTGVRRRRARPPAPRERHGRARGRRAARPRPHRRHHDPAAHAARSSRSWAGCAATTAARSTCSSAAAACSPSSRPCPKAPACGCAAAATVRSSCRSAPTNPSRRPGIRPSSNGSEASVFLCLHHRAGLTVAGRPRADHGLRRTRRGSAPRWSPRSRRTRCSHGPTGASCRRGRPRCSSLGAAFVFTLYAVEPHTTRHGFPTSETFGTLLRRPRRRRRTCCAPRSSRWPRTAARCCSRWSRSWIAGAIAEWSARRFDASLGAIGPSLVLFVAIAALGEGGWAGTTIAYASRSALLPRRVAPRRDDRAAELVPRRHADSQSRVLQGGILAARRDRARRRRRRTAAAGLAERRRGSTTGRSATAAAAACSKATTPIVSIQAKLLEDPRARGVHRRHR